MESNATAASRVPVQHEAPRARVVTSLSHLPALDGVRGLAILMVLVYHMVLWAADSLPIEKLNRCTLLGAHGVDLFFVLSGFLITGILWDTRRSQGFFRKFYARRTLRIFPLYYLTVFAVCVIGPLVARHDPKVIEVARQQGWLWSYTTNIALSLKRSWTFYGMNHFWSLAVEEQFYLLWPLCVWFAGRRALMRLCRVLILLALVLRGVLVLVAHNSLAAYSLMPCRMDALLLGALLALELRALRDGEAVVHIATRLRFAAALLIPAMVANLALLAVQGWLSDLLLPTACAVASTGLIHAATRAGSTMERIFRLGWLQFLGRYSYGIYVFHHILRQAITRLAPPASIASALHSDLLAALVFMIIGMAISIAMAVASYHLIEARFLSLKRWFSYAR